MVKVLLRCGIGYREFDEVAKTAFVEVATTEYGIRGRPTNMSRVAVMTGLTRKEIRRIRVTIDRGISADDLKTTPLATVLHNWMSNSNYTDSSGNPLDLPFDGESPSFTALVRQYAGDVPPGAMRTELKRVGCVEETNQGEVRFIKRRVIPKGQEERLILALLHTAAPLLENLAFNMEIEETAETWPQLNVYTKSLRSSDLPRIRRVARDRFVEFVESFDDMFMTYEALHNIENAPKEDNLVSIGVFYFEDIESDSRVW
jgi:hypothetical protein